MEISDVKTADWNTIPIRDCEYSMIQEMSSLKKEPQWSCQDVTGMKLEEVVQSAKYIDYSKQQVKNTEVAELSLGVCDNLLNQVLIEEIEKPSVWDVRDSNELVLISWEVQSTRDLKHCFERLDTHKVNESCFTALPHLLGQKEIIERKSILAGEPEESMVRKNTTEEDNTCLSDFQAREIHIEEKEVVSVYDLQASVVNVVARMWEEQTSCDQPSPNVDLGIKKLENDSVCDLQSPLKEIEDWKESSACNLQVALAEFEVKEWKDQSTPDLQGSLVEIETTGWEEQPKIPLHCYLLEEEMKEWGEQSTIDLQNSLEEMDMNQWEEHSFTVLQGSLVEVEIKEWVAPPVHYLPDLMDQVKIEVETFCANDVMDSVNQGTSIKEESSAMSLEDPIGEEMFEESKYHLSNVIGSSMGGVQIKREDVSTVDFKDEVKTKNFEEESFVDDTASVGQLKMERQEMLYAFDHQDHLVEVENEAYELVACDFYGPTFIIKTDEEISVGAECVVASTTGSETAKNFKIPKRIAEMPTTSNVGVAKVKKKTRRSLKHKHRKISGKRLKHTVKFERGVAKETNVTEQSFQMYKSPLQCKECKKTFTSIYSLSVHLKTHGERLRSFGNNGCHQEVNIQQEIKKYFCSTCGMSFFGLANLHEHQKTHLEPPCTGVESGRPISDSAGFETRDRQTVLKPHVCSKCGKSYHTKHKLTKHEETHAPVYQHTCVVCGKSYKLKVSLLIHQQTHEETHTCKECGESFSWRPQLTSHQKVHARAKFYSCPECGEAFASQYALDKHKLDHAGENPYLCGDCGESFKDTSSFLIHNKTHKHPKSFSCEVCGKKFTYKLSFTAHQQTHYWMDNTLLYKESVSAAV